jgi:hypothetical protein
MLTSVLLGIIDGGDGYCLAVLVLGLLQQFLTQFYTQ